MIRFSKYLVAAAAIGGIAAPAMAQYPQYPQYPQGYQQGYPQGYGQQPYAQNGYGANARVTAITNVERRGNGLRVSGVLDTGRYNGYGNQGYGQGYGYGQQGQAYAYGSPYAAASGDLTFRCSVAYNGAVTDVRLRQNSSWRRR